MEPTDIRLPTIAEVICNEGFADIYANFCTLIRLTGVDVILNDGEFLEGDFADIADFLENNPLISPEDRRSLMTVIDYDAERGFTVFAPTNEALAALFAPTNEALERAVQTEILEQIIAGGDVGLNIVLNHIIPEKMLFLSEVVCGRSYRMLNAENTRTECRTKTIKEQIGEGNILANGYPRFRPPTDIRCSNGIIQTVDGVILPEALRPPTASPTDAPTISSAPTSAPSISSAPSQAPPPCRAVTCSVCGIGSQVGKKTARYPVGSDSNGISCGDLEQFGPISCLGVNVVTVDEKCACEECTLP